MSFRNILLAATILASPLAVSAPVPASAQVAIEISVPTAPPVLPIYDQPPLPDAGYIWTPGYWSWSEPVGYYWVPGTWVLPPAADVLWTPPYWGWGNGAYVFHPGYWARQVGFYGGVNYGYGYGGNGYQGGRWQSGHFDYNRTVNNFGSVHVPNVYSSGVTVLNNTHVSYNGGTGGLRTAPGAADRQAAQEHHVPMTAEQTAHITAAAKIPDLAASRNSGHPAIAATSRPAQFEGPGVVHGETAGASQRSAHPAEAGPGPAADHAMAPPAEHETARPTDHAATPPAEHETTRSADHAMAPPAEHETAQPAQHEAPPPAREAQRPAEHIAAPPVERAPEREAARPEAAPRPAPPPRQATAEKEREK